ncbi:MAG: GNAT family N-acetyltransferase [Alphaproteobacteria bacterium]
MPDISILASSKYMLAAAPLEKGGVAMLAVYETDKGKLVHPFVRRAIPDTDDWFDLISVFDFGGFWMLAETTENGRRLVRGFEEAFGTWCLENNIVCEFVRLHPFVSFDTTLLSAYDVDLFCENVAIDLSAGYDRIFSEFSNSRQKQVRQGREKYGLTAEEIDDPALFTEVFHENLRRINSSGFYFFPQSFIREITPLSRMFFARTPEGEICAAHLYLVDGPVIFAYLCHGVAEHHHLRPNDFLYDHVLDRFSRDGFKSFHFGGGAKSLMAYKKSFGPGRVNYRIANRIFNREVYDELSAGKIAQGASGFFPRYRQKTKSMSQDA